MNGRSIIVTGGFGALGRVVAAAFAAQGDKVARIDFAPCPPDAMDGVIDLAGVDLTDMPAVDKAVAEVTTKLGGVDVLVNIAGGFIWETLEGGSIDAWERMFTMNVKSNATITKVVLPVIKLSSAGRIINIGAGAAIQAAAGMGPYAAAKAGVHRLTEALATELADSSVTVNAILPSIIDTPANRADMPDADTSQWVKPQAIADVILFLASPAARSISGALIPATRG
ncbi:SDR family NAD(P)-dependent oxidoreductase [Sphingobium sp.]|uniref:SDR family NAD(P)-dependent oxidoreductase n=1 Tax=Sphingobium sp. TaxID=1912891 RepID=UPI002C85CA13|nr:SDR family NAD(P)-dependent oxidoreductase [Sphingobium sp.]HUD89973.1 SDR family NAD(P)-dependent oxidoreductase [Sphingobium sp.]